MKKTLTLSDIGQTAKDIIDRITKGKAERATIMAFYGELGAGKTTLTQEVARQLGVKESIISPTFVIMKIYKTKHEKFKKLVHIDAYRLKNSQELLALGWEEIAQDNSNFIIVEWPERAPECFNSGCHILKLEHKDETTRTIEIEYN